MAFVQLYMDTTSGLPQICNVAEQAEVSFFYRKCSKGNYISQRKHTVLTLNWIYVVVSQAVSVSKRTDTTQSSYGQGIELNKTKHAELIVSPHSFWHWVLTLETTGKHDT